MIRKGHAMSASIQSDLQWIKSSASSYDGNCLELADDGHNVHIRDSKNKETTVSFSYGSWMAFVQSVKQEGFASIQ
jgi:Domain of unknown function (DUF397)